MLIHIITDNEFIYKLERVGKEVRWIYIGRQSPYKAMHNIEIIPANVTDAEILNRDEVYISSDDEYGEKDGKYTYPYFEGDF